jgi:hypothetical protein
MAMADRIGTARERALALTDDLSEANQVSVVEASTHPRVLVAFARDRELVAEAIGSLRAGGGRADLSTAIRLARGLATPDRPTNVLIFSDGGDGPLPEEPVAGAEMVRFDDFGPNLAISAWSLEPSTAGTTRAFLNISNFGAEDRSVQAEVSVNGLTAGLLELDVAALGSARLTTPVDAGPGDLVSVRLRDNQDALPMDDGASLIVGSGPEKFVAMAGEGSPFLEALVDAVPGFTTEGEGEGDIAIVDGGPLPEIERPTWLIAPESVPEGVIVSELAGNLAVTYQRPGEPILDSVDLSEMVVGEAHVVAAPRWLALVRSGDVPLILLGDVNGHRVAYFTFDLTRSNLPVQVGFPILGARILEWLGGTSAGSVSTDRAGVSIPISAPAGTAARVTMPDGSVRNLTEAAVEFADTAQPGVYRVEYVGEDDQVLPGATVVRTFVPDESAGASRAILTSGRVTEAEEASTRLREWAPWVIAVALLLMAIEWWVGHQRPFLRKAVA